MLAATPLLAACSAGAPAVSPRTGVDGLLIPTPSPDPADFTSPPRNRWLLPGPTSWEYEVRSTGTANGGVGDLAKVSMTLKPGESVAGLPVSTLSSRGLDARGRELWSTADDLAEDRSRNVWWVARRAVGEAPDGVPAFAVGDAGPGLYQAGEPRLGDGYWMVRAGSTKARATVMGVDVRADGYERLVQVERVAGSVRTLHSYAAGVGLVALSRGSERWRLIDHA